MVNFNESSKVLKEYVRIETNDYIIYGTISSTIRSKNNRVLSNVLNSNRDFVAIENCTIQPKRLALKDEIESVDFMEINKASILIMKPVVEN